MDDILNKNANKTVLITGHTSSLDIDYNIIKHDYNLLYLCLKDFNDIKILDKRFNIYLTYQVFFDCDKEKLIIIDEVYLLNKKHLSYLKKKLSDITAKKITCILISNNKSYKLKKLLNIDCINIEKKKNSLYIDDIIKEKNLVFTKKLKQFIALITNNNLKKTTELIDLISLQEKKKYTFNSEYELISNIENINNSETKLFNIIKYIFTNTVSIKDILNYYNLEKTHLPLTIYENYFKFIDKKDENSIQVFKKISENFSDGELVNTFMIKKQKWNLNDNVALLQCYYPSMILKNKKMNNININFSNIIAQDSIIIRKNNYIYNFLQNTKIVEYLKMDIYYTFKYMLYNLLSNDKTEGLTYFKENNISAKDIDKLLNIINDDKLRTLFTNKVKKEISKIKIDM